MSDLLVTPRGTSRAAAATAALASGFVIADRARPYVQEIVSGVKRAYSSLRDYRQVQYGPGSGRFRRERQLVKKRLRFEEPLETTTLKLSDYKKESTDMSNSVQFTRQSDQIGRKRRRSAKQLFDSSIGRMNELIFRWQQVSPSLLGPGENILAYGRNVLTPNSYVCPIVFMSLTNQLLGSESADLGCQDNGLHRLTYSSTTKGFGYQRLSTQNSNGTYVSPAYTYESGSVKPSTYSIEPKVFHKWSDIRLNLYGSAYYPLTYEILVLTGMSTDMSVFDFPVGPDSIPEIANMNAYFRDHVKDYIGNPIVGTNIDRTDLVGKVRVLRRKIIKIAPLSYGDAAAEPSAPLGIDASNVKNVNMFIRHDRFRDYGWTPRTTDETLQPALDGTGFDKTNTSVSAANTMLTDCDRDERVYLFIKCSAPKLIEAPEFDITAENAPVAELAQTAIPQFSGSYDIVVRNCFRYSYAG